MSLFSIPDDLLPRTMLDDVMKQTDRLVPGEFSNPVNFMAQPLAGAAAMSAFSVGLASHAIGVWFGTMTAATSASQRMFMPMFEGFALDVADFREKPRATAAEPELLVPPAKVRAKKAKPVAEDEAGVTEAVELPVTEDAAPPEPRLAFEVPQVEPQIEAPVAVEADAVAFVPPISDETATEAQPVAGEAPAAEPVLAEVIATPAETLAVVDEAPVADFAEPATSAAVEAPVVEAVVESVPKPISDAKPAEPVFGLMPEDYRKPAAIDRPEHPDDLKSITGIGPKLEKVLNGLGVWTYAQIAAWQRDEIAWIDDTLGFRGRIGRDGWLAQAASLAGAKVEKSE